MAFTVISNSFSDGDYPPSDFCRPILALAALAATSRRGDESA